VLCHQRVDGVLAAKKVHPAKETYCAEDPPNGVSGAAGGDEDANRRATRHYHRSPERELEDGDSWMRPIQHKEYKA
jgi:hypothetical protein